MGVWLIVVGVVGLAAAAVLVLFGRDLVRASQTGPRWKRRLIVAALALLSAAGVYNVGGRLIEVKTAAAAEGKTGTLSESKAWQRVGETWTEADNVASGRKGPYPFDRKGKEALLAALKTREGDLDALVTAKLLSPPEAGLLKKELARLAVGVQEKRPTEMRMATCYDPVAVVPARDSARRLSDRVDLLEKLAAVETLHPAATVKALIAIEADLVVLDKDEHLKGLREDERPKAVEVRTKVAALVETVRARLPKAPALIAAPQWKRFQATWTEADDVASGRKGAYPFDRKGKEALLAALSERATDLDALGAAGLLTAPEAGLLKKDLSRLTRGVQAKRPTEMRMATCYKPMMFLPARDSANRLADRLELLGRLVEAKTLHPVATAKILVSIDKDLAVLGKEEHLKRLNEAERTKALETRKSAAALAETIRARLPQAQELTKTPQWQAVQDMWKFVKPLADSGQSTTAQRKQAEEKFKASAQAVAELTGTGTLTHAEAGLLTDEAATLRSRMLRNPPTDMQVKCYQMVLILPARQSLTRLTKRLPLLQSIAQSGKVSPAVVGKVLPTVRADLAMLNDEAQAARLGAGEQDRARKLRAEAAAAAAAIEKLVKGTK